MSSSEVALTASAVAEKKLGSTMMRWSLGLAALPDPIPLVDEILFASVFAIGAGLYAFQPVTGSLSNFGNSAETSQSHPRVTSKVTQASTTGHSRRGNGKKQMSSTSSSYSKRRNYYYTKRRQKRYNRY